MGTPTRRVTCGAAVLALALGVGACSGSGEPDEAPSPSPAASSRPSEGALGADGAPAQPVSAARPDARRCLAVQRWASFELAAFVQRLVVRVLARRTPYDEPVRRMERTVTRLVDEAERPCRGLPTALGALQERIAATDVGTVDERQVRDLVRVLQAWGRSIDRGDNTWILFDGYPCRRMREDVPVTLEVTRVQDAAGDRLRIALVVRSRWGTPLYVDHGGSVDVTGVLPDGGSRRFTWGASSADTAEVRPGATTRIRPSLVPGDVSELRVADWGDAAITSVYAAAYRSIGPCGLPVARSG